MHCKTAEGKGESTHWSNAFGVVLGHLGILQKSRVAYGGILQCSLCELDIRTRSIFVPRLFLLCRLPKIKSSSACMC